MFRIEFSVKKLKSPSKMEKGVSLKVKGFFHLKMGMGDTRVRSGT